MIRSLFIAKTGMDSSQFKLDTISNNLANVSTNGFKRQRAVFETLTSATPGAIAAGTDAEGRVVYHCLDTRLPIAEGLARDERQLLRLYREDACR